MDANKSTDKTRTYLINGDFIKFHTVFKDGTEIVEEYGLISEEIFSRKVKKLKLTGKEEWFTEIGDGSPSKKDEDFLIKENDNNPILVRKDSATDFQWRIRNLNYPKSNFIVECDKTKQEIIVKTVNKKYYKRIGVPDLMRLKIPLDESNLKVNFLNNTLVISYTKPEAVLAQESEIIQEIRRIRKEIKDNPDTKYDPGCKNQ